MPKEAVQVEEGKKHSFAQGFSAFSVKFRKISEGELATQEQKINFFAFVISFTKHYLFCFKSMLNVRSGREVRQMTKILTLIAVHVVKEYTRDSFGVSQNHLSGLNLAA